MMNKPFTALALAGILVALLGCGANATPTPSPEPTTPPTATLSIVLGKVSSKPAEKIQEYQPLADYLADNLHDLGIGSGKVKVAQDMETMAHWLASGEVDLFFDNPYSSLVVSDLSGGQPVLIRVKEGADTKHGVFFALADGDIASLADLEGQIIALEEPDSSAGYMLPVVHLLEAGIKPVEEANLQAEVAEDEVGYVFSLDDDNTVQWVLDGRVVAGVIDDEAFAEYAAENPDKLLNLAETEPILRHQLTIARPDMDPELLESIKELLMELNETEAGDTVLAPSETLRFDDLVGEWAGAVARIKEMYARLKGR